MGCKTWRGSKLVTGQQLQLWYELLKSNFSHRKDQTTFLHPTTLSLPLLSSAWRCKYSHKFCYIRETLCLVAYCIKKPSYLWWKFLIENHTENRGCQRIPLVKTEVSWDSRKFYLEQNLVPRKWVWENVTKTSNYLQVITSHTTTHSSLGEAQQAQLLWAFYKSFSWFHWPSAAVPLPQPKWGLTHPQKWGNITLSSEIPTAQKEHLLKALLLGSL